MNDISIKHALLLWNRPMPGKASEFAVRPIGHDDYDRFDFKVGACFREWKELAKADDIIGLKLQLMIEVWHAVTFHGVAVGNVHKALLCIPEYRDMLADDCLPREFRGERE